LSVPRYVLDYALLEIARERGVEVREGYRVHDVWLQAGVIQGVVGPSGERLGAGLVVGADGLNSVIARGVGARGTARWPRRLGLVAHFDGVDWPEDFGRMLVGVRGYVGIAPLDDNGQVSVGLVRSMPGSRLGSAVGALEAALVDYPDVTDRLKHGNLVGSVQGIGPLARRVRMSAGPGFALVGDAAGFFDPFTGEGIFRALRGAELLASFPETYSRQRAIAFGPKERMVKLIQVLVQTPRLMDFTIHRLQRRRAIAGELGCMLGDLQPARLALILRLLGP
jgi:flavin-dependent dehydrogenase